MYTNVEEDCPNPSAHPKVSSQALGCEIPDDLSITWAQRKFPLLVPTLFSECFCSSQPHDPFFHVLSDSITLQGDGFLYGSTNAKGPLSLPEPEHHSDNKGQGGDHLLPNLAKTMISIYIQAENFLNLNSSTLAGTFVNFAPC